MKNKICEILGKAVAIFLLVFASGGIVLVLIFIGLLISFTSLLSVFNGAIFQQWREYVVQIQKDELPNVEDDQG